MPANTCTFTTYLPIIISIIAIGLSIADFVIAKRALRISQIDFEERKPNLVPYLINGFSLIFPDYKIYAFYISVSNRSNNDNGIAEINLKIEFAQEINNLGNLLFQHDDSLVEKIILPSNHPFSMPVEIGAHKTVSGWVLCKASKSILQSKTIENYRIQIIDSHAMLSQVNQIIIQERVANEK
jgi:hypothetical protein